MIQFSGGNGKKRYIGISLSEENVRRLKEGDPAVVDLLPHGIEGTELLIFYGKSEDEMIEMINEHFVVRKPS